MFYDYHVHSSFSIDCDVTMEAMILSALDKGVAELAFTDHIDLEYPDPRYTFDFDYKAFSQNIIEMREKYGDKIQIVKGLELGLQSFLMKDILHYLKDKSYDFILGSIHTTNDYDLYDKECPLYELPHHEAFTEFLSYTLRCIKNIPYFNVLGHLDVIRRYAPYGDNRLSYFDHTDLIDEILLYLIDTKRGIELNTGGIRYNLKDPFLDTSILKRYRELGGVILTLGSDAHKPGTIATGFKDAVELLKSLDFHYIARYPGGNLIFDKID